MACQDFHRTGGLTRRALIGRGVGGLAVYTARAMPLSRVLESAGAAHAAAPEAPILVSVFLPGGVDLLDTLIPRGADYGAYADKRPTLKMPEGGGGLSVLDGGRLALHPSFSQGRDGGIAGLYERGQVGFLPGIDYADPDLSHFHSRHFWETGLITQKAASGWLGRWLDVAGGRDNPLQGVALSGSLAPVLRSAAAPVAAVRSPNASDLWMPGVWGEVYDRSLAAYAELAAVPRHGTGAQAAGTSAKLMHEVGRRLQPYRHGDDQPDPLAGPVTYPERNALAEHLKNLAGMLAQPLGIRVAAVDAEGEFDTHDNQREDLDKGLVQVSEALAAFQADLAARGLAQRVLTFVWSEFGRRVEQNESGGTDHGAGGLAFVMGARAKSGILTEYPSVSALDPNGNLAVTVDFRRVYCSLLEQWLGTDAARVIPDAATAGRVALVA
jgi:uncharacterized protein (DUF1501 family)